MKVRGTFFCVMLFVVAGSPAAAGRVALTPEDAIATTRLLGDGSFFLSPLGGRYAFALITGDLGRDGNWMTIMVGELSSLEAAAKPRSVVRLFGRSLGDANTRWKSDLTIDGKLTWLDENRLAFLWEDEHGVLQLYAVDVSSGAVMPLTRHPTSINASAWAAGLKGEVLYSAIAYDEAAAGEVLEAAKRDGFVLTGLDMGSLLRGDLRSDLLDRVWGYKWFIARPGRPPVEVSINGRDKSTSTPRGAHASADGRRAVVGAYPLQISEEWKRYTGLWRSAVVSALEGSTDDFLSRQLTQLYVVDLSDGSARPLWNALTMAGTRSAIEFSPDARRVLVGRTFLPPESDAPAGFSGEAMAEVDVRSGKFWIVPLPARQEIARGGLRWLSHSKIEVTTAQRVFLFEKSAGSWKPAPPGADSRRIPVQLKVHRDLNSPTALVAVERATGRELKIAQPDADLPARFKLGRVEKAAWTDEWGRPWEGELYHPADDDSAQRYPFVLQTHGGSDSFSLYGYPDTVGQGTGGGVYIAQALAGRNVGVLQIRDEIRNEKITPLTQAEHGGAYMRGYDAAVRWLVGKGLADPGRIGLQGFSRTGWLTQYSLANSAFVYAAAIAADNIEGGYVENMLLGPGTMEAENGGEPFGTGLKSWLENAPAFNADRIHTPLLKIRQQADATAYIGGPWEMYVRLKRLGRPVELYVMPDADKHGTHIPQNPRQVAALQHRALDWWLFWLKGEENPSPAKAAQYASWRQLREQRDAVLKQPRPPLLEWTATPKRD